MSKALSVFASLSGALLLGAGAALAGCKGTGDAPSDADRPGGVSEAGVVPGSAPVGWTHAFEREVVLVADRITIEGPADLLDHVAIRQEPEVFQMTTETVPEGLRQVVRRRQNVAGGGEIRAQLDAWSLAAVNQLTVLQRPGEVPVRIVAEGSAVWIPADGGDELRRPRLEFHGQRGR